MRNYIRNLALTILGSFKSPSNSLHILNGHYISKEEKPAEVFVELLESLKKKVEFINIDEASEIVLSKKNPKGKLLAFTFDDGFEECFTKIAPVLKSFNVNAAFFLNPNFIDGDEKYRTFFIKNKLLLPFKKDPMTWDMVRQLHQEGFIIGSHTLDHERLNSTNKEFIKNQIAVSKSKIENQLKSSCEYFAYPYGGTKDFSEESRLIALENHKYVFSGCYHEKYLSFNNTVINRRHFEGDWSPLHLNYFLSLRKTY